MGLVFSPLKDAVGNTLYFVLLQGEFSLQIQCGTGSDCSLRTEEPTDDATVEGNMGDWDSKAKLGEL